MNTSHHLSTTSLVARTFLRTGRSLPSLIQRCKSHSEHAKSVRRKEAQARRRIGVCAQVDSSSSEVPVTDRKEEVIEVVLEKPLGLRFARGNDGGAYVAQNDAKIGNTDDSIEIGDKILEVSASFGDDVWEAKNFGQVMFAIRTRNGGVYLKIKRMFGDLSALQEEESTAAEKLWRKERAGGNVGIGTREVQLKNYEERQKSDKEKLDLFNGALKNFRAGDVEQALIDFENVISLEPRKYMSDSFARVSDVCMVAHYNAACCYSALNNIDSGLEALESALAAGFEDYRKVRSDPNLETLRGSEKFKILIDKYDEPFINENAINVIKGLFSFGKKDED